MTTKKSPKKKTAKINTSQGETTQGIQQEIKEAIENRRFHMSKCAGHVAIVLLMMMP